MSRFPLRLLAGAAAAYVGIAWCRYGHPARRKSPLLDRFMPPYDVVECHATRVAAPADVTLQASTEAELQSSPLFRAIFRTREWILGADPREDLRPHGLLAECLALGWGILAEEPGREIVVGAVTQPWEANVVFRASPPEAFAAFDEPGS